MAKRLSEINSTATFAWSPGQQTPLIAAGTAAGALDDSFSNTSELELFKLDFKNTSHGAVSVAKVASSARFNKLAWGNASSSHPYGVIVGGLENGHLALWDPSKILDGKSEEEAKTWDNSTHSGQIRGLDFNKFQTNLLASAGTNNEVYIWDLTKPDTPYNPGPKSSKLDDITSVGWNGQVQHILATSSSNGHTVVWDLRNRKEVMTLSAPNSGVISGRKNISSVVWHPDVATQLVTASEDDSNPVVTLWDLRHAHSPEKILAGHTKGVLGVSWCRQDSDLLLSCGKDCKTLVWNPNSGELLGELAQDNNWTFQTEWCPRNPDLLASASFDGKISVYSLQNSGSQDDVSAVDTTNDDPFTAALKASAPAASAGFSLKHPPKWLRRPVGATFSFGGKLVSFNNKAGQAAAQVAANLRPDQVPAPQVIPRAVKITSIVTDKEIVNRSEELEIALQQQDVEQLVESRRQLADQDKESWEVIKSLLAPDAREQLMNYLGFQKSEIAAAVAKITAEKKGTEITTKEEFTEETVVEQAEPAPEVAEKTDDAKAEEPKTDSVSGLFQSDNAAEDFFATQTEKTDHAAPEVDIAQAIGSAIQREPLQLYSDENSDVDHLITRAVVLGDFESAVNLCLSVEKFSDALMFAICGGGDLLQRTQQAYFKHQSKTSSYLRLLESIIEEDLSSIVATVSLEEWTSIIAVLCTFAKAEDFKQHCEALGARLEDALADDNPESTKELRRRATLCYLAAGNLEKVSRIWIAEQEELAEKNKNEGVYAFSLQQLIEKVTIFRKVISFEDPALLEVSESKLPYEYPLAPLYDKYCEYADLLASQGKLTTALSYLSLTPVVYRKATFDKLSIIRDRVYHACPSSVTSLYSQPTAPFESKPIVTESAMAEPQAAQPVASAFPQTTSAQAQQHPSYQPYQPATFTPQTQATATTHVTSTFTQQAQYTPQYQPAAASYTQPQPTVSQPYQPTSSVYAPQAQAQAQGSQYQPYQPYQSTGYNNYPAATAPYSPQYSNAASTTYSAPRPSIPAPPPITGVAPSPRSQPQQIPPPPKKPQGAWNDPPMALAANKKSVKSPKVATAPAKRVTSPFPTQPAATAFAPPPQQHHQPQPHLPPPPQQHLPPPPQKNPLPPPPQQARPPLGPPPRGPPQYTGPRYT
ncbi:WD40 repeat-like protein [Rhizopus microsporus var. microsporus]|uniref:Protein transport protein SEC31 n=2 Tax=Rhizopus microsporus TaxID=58291 RepID=A0A2G4T6T5_RHIZD|nr:WD40 repeat-like protein [Rhizopus microsporus ATCC 52813]ORE07814.1 WD40 repeat-like protein [Rhizopus microsporus var. microsporus]PHZ16701.1 WD40 repeat-like protein [Rhizopus microsporus ATCC 52813]